MDLQLVIVISQEISKLYSKIFGLYIKQEYYQSQACLTL